MRRLLLAAGVMLIASAALAEQDRCKQHAETVDIMKTLIRPLANLPPETSMGSAAIYMPSVKYDLLREYDINYANLVAAFKAFTASAEDLEYALRKCAR